MSDDALLEAARLMWPDPAVVQVQRVGVAVPVPAGSQVRRFILVPSAADPKLAVPAEPRAAAAAVARSHSAPGSLVSAARTRLMSAAFASGFGGRLLRDRLVVTLPAGATGLDDLLSQVLGQPVVVGLRVGPPRANRKPVLPVVTPRGMLVAYAKLGINDLTDRLVADEGAALTRLAKVSLPDVAIPTVLYAGQWQGHQLLVQSPLPVRRSVGDDLAARTTQAMVTVAGAEGAVALPLAELGWWARTREAADRLPPSKHQEPLQAIGSLLVERSSQSILTGGWHGDWNPGNCAVLPDSVLVWDWERYETGVPLGFDALHLRLQSSIGAGVSPRDAAQNLLAESAILLAPFGVSSGDARLVVQLYLWGLGVRYATDDQARAGAAIGQLDEWLIPALTPISQLKEN